MKSFIREKHTNGNVYWKDFYRVIREKVDTNRLKFAIFKTLIKCGLFGENLVICSDKTKKRVINYGFGDEVFHHSYCVCEEILNRICYRALIMGKDSFPQTIIKFLSITFYSYYYIMTPRHRLQQPKRILESKLLKHITNPSDFEKNNKYGFLSFIYRPVSCDDVNIYVYNDD